MAEKVEEVPKLVKDAKHRQYLPSDKLGAGGFASVWRARVIDRRLPPEATECALKVIKSNIKSKQMQTRFKFELGIHNKLHHPNIVEFYRAFTYQDLTYVSLELCLNGSLTDMVKRRKYLTMGEIRRYLVQLCGAVKYLHTRDIVHRDIKAGNVFLDEQMNVKLGDFGLAAIMVPEKPGVFSASYARRTTFCGTPNYLAPEILSRGGHDRSVDIWAIGILAFYLAVGRAPFHSKSKEEIYERVRRSDYEWPELGPDQNEVPEDLKMLVATLLVSEAERPTPDQIVRNPFFSEGFIPQRIDSLAKTRRPRWGRAAPGTLPNSRATYEELCRASQVGLNAPPSRTLGTRTSKRTRAARQEHEPLMVTLEREFSSGVTLNIPMPNGGLYLAFKPTPAGRGTATLAEDDETTKIDPRVGKNAEAANGVLTESNANTTKDAGSTRRMVKRQKIAPPAPIAKEQCRTEDGLA
ncbi:MAG: Cell cycle serine/threonine-protein kinase cdc5/MSD2 [Alyxoria varia]|nr:MAG: Cell cycle serine/threonine-protein kinase cdc5/MSD2 [Alyxoria varia]